MSAPRATVEPPAAPAPPPPDRARAQVRAAVGAGQVAYGVLRLRKAPSGWYHILLGGRQLVQARLDAAGAFSPAADAAVDGLHVATMLGLALLRRTHRRSALLGAGHAAAWALFEAVLSRGDPPAVPAATVHRSRG